MQALTAILGGAFALVLLPETKDKTFTELENIFSHSSSKDQELVWRKMCVSIIDIICCSGVKEADGRPRYLMI